MAIIYHITTKSAWAEAQLKGRLEELSLAEEGFIHCSEARQIPGVLERYFSGKSDLLKLTIDSDKLSSPLIYDWSPSMKDTFPHVYGPIQPAAVIGVDKI
jgi:uncharacterized protein (DUF952 family)